MAYPNYPYQSPMGYNQPLYPSYQQAYQQPYQNLAVQPQAGPAVQQQPTQQPAQPVIQNGGFVSVRSIEEARNYPVAPGNSITFKDENAPYVYTKTMGFSQLDRPVFEIFRLVKEEDIVQTSQNAQASGQNVEPNNPHSYVSKEQIEAFEGEIAGLKQEIALLKQQINDTKKSAQKAKKEEKEADE